MRHQASSALEPEKERGLEGESGPEHTKNKLYMNTQIQSLSTHSLRHACSCTTNPIQYKKTKLLLLSSPPLLFLIFTLVGLLHLPPRPPHHLTPSPHPNSQKKYPTIFILISGLRVKGKESHPYLRNNRPARQCWWLRPALLAALAVATRCAEPSCPVWCVCVCARARACLFVCRTRKNV